MDLHFNKIPLVPQRGAKDLIFYLNILRRLCIQGTDERGKGVEINEGKKNLPV